MLRVVDRRETPVWFYGRKQQPDFSVNVKCEALLFCRSRNPLCINCTIVVSASDGASDVRIGNPRDVPNNAWSPRIKMWLDFVIRHPGRESITQSLACERGNTSAFAGYPKSRYLSFGLWPSVNGISSVHHARSNSVFINADLYNYLVSL